MSARFVPRALAHRTDLIFANFESQVSTEYDAQGHPYLCIRTPARPDYFWGNTLLFSDPPEPEDFQRWPALYRQHFSDTGFMTLSWDAPDGNEGAIEAFLNAGFERDLCEVLAISRSHLPLPAPRKWNPDLELRPLSSEKDWQAVIEVHLNGHWKLNPAHQRPFVEGQMAMARAMVEAGLGLRFGAFFDGKLVGDMGVYWTETQLDGHRERVGRFHEVATHGAYFRQGICSSLMSFAIDQAFERFALDQLVIVADQDDFPRQLYAEMGFRHCEWQAGLQWHDPERYA